MVLALPELLALQGHLAGWVRSVPREQLVPRALWVRLAVLERLVPLVQVLLEHLVGWAHSVPGERLVPLVLGEVVVQLVPPGPRALQVRLAG